jgi:hypothetical protein
LLYPGPLCGGELGTTGRAAGVDTDVDSFRTGRKPVRKARPRLTDLPGRRPGKRQAGWPFSLVTFLFGHTKRKLSLPGFGRHLVNGFCLSLRWRAVAIERVQALTIVKDLDVVKHLGLHLVMRLMATR